MIEAEGIEADLSAPARRLRRSLVLQTLLVYEPQRLLFQREATDACGLKYIRRDTLKTFSLPYPTWLTSSLPSEERKGPLSRFDKEFPSLSCLRAVLFFASLGCTPRGPRRSAVPR